MVVNSAKSEVMKRTAKTNNNSINGEFEGFLFHFREEKNNSICFHD